MSVKLLRKMRQGGEHEKARELAVQLAADRPNDAQLQFETACVHDYLGREAEAVPFYLAAIKGNLDKPFLRQAFLGLGSTYRVLGQYVEAKQALLDGLSRFPHANELKVFLAMTLHNLGEAKESVELLLKVVAKTSDDKAVRSYRKAIAFYAADIDKTWEA
ncbi:tetratricopeptide (TPR) repeat protein [Paraburkholderia sp. GAS206C]|jgi:tetratricopeptide (TPR) repeat protein|uniref:tetratricopeptide repeat protein n=1 Tax=unclassified Paraburkholderia TaxID=2615204 RepID=UPI003D1A0BFD